MAWPTTSRHARGYGTAWDKLRKVVLARDKHLCCACKRKGRITVGTHVDHIMPKAKGGTDDISNLQCLCAPCHEEKTARDEGKVTRVTIGADGWPVT